MKTEELIREIVLFAALTLAGASVAAWLWRRLDLGAWLLPPHRQRAVPWSGFEICGVIFLFFLSVGIADGMLISIGWYDWLYGPGFVQRSDLKSGDALAKASRGLWMTVAGFPLQVAAVLLLLRSSSGTLPYQLGLTTHRLGRNVLLGFVAWLVTAPLVLVLGGLVTLFLQSVLGVAPEKHPYEEIGRSEWLLMMLAAVVVAPVTEELLFRGVIQRFLMNRWWGGDVALAGAYVLAILSRWSGLKEAVDSEDHAALLREAQPALFVLAMLAVYLVVRRFWPSPTVRTIYGTALLFAAAHSFAWPSPVPLFFLSLVLGWLAERTQSLVPSITLHALFNAIAVVVLLIPQAKDQNGKEETMAPRRPVPVSTSSLVPGS